jgi:hypothetical protein
VIDWSSLDNDMLGIRTRGLASRRLEQPEKSTQVTIESLAYVVPIVFLVVLGLNLRWRRKNAAPMFGGPAVRTAPSSPSHTEA